MGRFQTTHHPVILYWICLSWSSLLLSLLNWYHLSRICYTPESVNQLSALIFSINALYFTPIFLVRKMRFRRFKKFLEITPQVWRLWSMCITCELHKWNLPAGERGRLTPFHKLDTTLPGSSLGFREHSWQPHCTAGSCWVCNHLKPKMSFTRNCY